MRSEEHRSGRCQCSVQCHPQYGLDCDAEYKLKCTAAVVMMGKERLRVAYRIALVMGQEVHSIAAHPISLYNILVESNSPSGRNTITVGDVCTFDVRAGGEHPLFLLVVGVIV